MIQRHRLGVRAGTLGLVCMAVLGVAACGSSSKTPASSGTQPSPGSSTTTASTQPAKASTTNAPASATATSVDLTATGYKVFHVRGTKTKDCSHGANGTVNFAEISSAQYPAIGAGYTIDIATAAEGGVVIANKFGREEDNTSATGLNFTPPGTFVLHDVKLSGAYKVTLSGKVVCGT
jgi:hypothetical protein